MTPTLSGRWQTRLVLLGTLGSLVSWAFFRAVGDPVFFFVLAYVFVFGVVWDVLWITLQKFRWDRDWPTTFQIGAAVIEGAWLYTATSQADLPLIPRGSLELDTFLMHYGLVWLATFVCAQGPIRTAFPRWRYRGGRFI
jgi:hypothetical protein